MTDNARAIAALKTPEMVEAILYEASAVDEEQMGERKLLVVVSRIIPMLQVKLTGNDFVAAELVSFTKELVQSVFNDRLSGTAPRVARAVLAMGI